MTDTPAAPARRIDYVPLGDLTAADRNPKAHDIDAVEASIARFGYADAAVADERTGRLLAGHGRTAALTRMHQRGDDPPRGVHTDPATGDWLVPVQRGWASRDDAEAEALLTALNRAGERGGWNTAVLVEQLDRLAAGDDPTLLAAAGYSTDDLDRLTAALGGTCRTPPRTPPTTPRAGPTTSTTPRATRTPATAPPANRSPRGPPPPAPPPSPKSSSCTAKPTATNSTT